MTILRWTPRQPGWRPGWPDMDRLRNQLEGLLESASETLGARVIGGAGVYPLLNLSEDEDHLYLTAELPGVSAEDLDISIHGDSLTLRGERKIPETDKKVNYHRREREAGFFRRGVNLPVKIDSEHVKATVVNGILSMTMPKAAEAKARQIKVEGV